MLAALTAVIMLPLLRVYHPPGIALAMCPALLHSGAWFAIQDVLPVTLSAVISRAVLSRLSNWQRRGAGANRRQELHTIIRPIRIA